MPIVKVSKIKLNCDVHGNTGSWVALVPGGRRGMEAARKFHDHAPQV